MAEYLHLYNEETDHNLRGTTYQVQENGWVPATFAGDPDTGTAVEVIALLVKASTEQGIEDAIGALQQMLAEAERRSGLERMPDTQTYLKHQANGGADEDYRLAEVVGGAARRMSVIGRRTVPASSSEFWAVVELRVEHRCPFGYYELLENRVENESFEVDSDGDGLCDNWAELADAAGQTASHVAVDNDYGAKAQRLQYAGATSNVGVESDAITVDSATAYTLSAWVDNNNAATAVRVFVYDDTHSAMINDSILSWTAGETPSRKSASFSTPAGCVAARVMAYINGTDAAGDWTIDAVYLGLKLATSLTVWDNLTGRVAAPQGWCTHRKLHNHDDGRNLTTDQNYVIVADVPGDLDALVENVVYIQSEGALSLLSPILCARRTNREVQLSTSAFWLQAEGGTPSAGFALDTDAGASGAAANNVRDHTLAAAYAEHLDWSLTAVSEMMPGTYRPILFCKRTGAAVNMTAKLDLDDAGGATEEVAADIGTSWQALRLGLLQIPACRASRLYEDIDLVIRLWVKGSTEEVRFDGVLLLALDEEFGEIPATTALAATNAGDRLVFSGERSQALFVESGGDQMGLPDEGLCCHLTPAVAQKLTYLALSDSSGTELWEYSADLYISLLVRPRYRSL